MVDKPTDAELLQRSRERQQSFEDEYLQERSTATTRSDAANAEFAARPEPTWTLENPAEKFASIHKMLGIRPQKIADHTR